jgi:hypothetical protein
MNTSKRLIKGSINIIICASCKIKFPIFSFEDEADTDSIGLYSAGSCISPDVAVVEATNTEWNEIVEKKSKELPSRIIKILGRDDFRIAQIIRVEKTVSIPQGTSFSDYRKLYQRPVVVYSCPCCIIGESTLGEELTLQQFYAIGGKTLMTGNLELI